MIGLIFSLIFILLAAECFTNGIEAFGKKHSLSQAVAGSILAAVGTALPETILPIVAILTGSAASGKEIGVGAILGAPFMLGTLAFFVTAAAAAGGAMAGKRSFSLDVEIPVIRRDLTFFVVMYSLAVFVPLATKGAFNKPLSLVLLTGYIIYIIKTAHGESGDIEQSEGLYTHKFMKKVCLSNSISPSTFLIVFQIIISLFVMVYGAHMFVKSLEYITLKLGVSALLFSLILAPIATELPEKFNSITWILKKRDSLALGNITGAMVFQSTFPVSVGLLMTDWVLTPLAFLSAIVALLSAVIVLINIKISKKISPFVLLSGGVFYLCYILLLLNNLKG